jgi:hypothetical protein
MVVLAEAPMWIQVWRGRASFYSMPATLVLRYIFLLPERIKLIPGAFGFGHPERFDLDLLWLSFADGK